MESTFGIGHAATLLGVTVKTLQRWEREGRLIPAERTASNRRRYTESQLRTFLRLPSLAVPRRVVAYCRVSSAAQRPDLVNQRKTLEQFTAARGLAGVEYVEEVGSGLDFERKRFLALARAAGTARRVWNWALAEWQRQAALGLRPNALALKKQFYAIKYAHPDWLDEQGQPWLRTIHRDAHAQPFAHLAKAWSPYFAQRRASEKAYPPRFKAKGRCRDAYYLANDTFRLATAASEAGQALPVASPAATPGTAAGRSPAGGGKVTPVRHEHGRQDGSGQEENAAHCRARSR